MFYCAAASVVVLTVLAQVRALLISIRDERKASAEGKAEHHRQWSAGELWKASKLNALHDALKSAGVPKIGGGYPANRRYKVIGRRVESLSPGRARVEIDYRHDDGETTVTSSMSVPTGKTPPLQAGDVVTNGKGEVAIVAAPSDDVRKSDTVWLPNANQTLRMTGGVIQYTREVGTACDHRDNPSHTDYCRFCGAQMPRRATFIPWTRQYPSAAFSSL